jgi:hypothetical protein
MGECIAAHLKIDLSASQEREFENGLCTRLTVWRRGCLIERPIMSIVAIYRHP